MNRKQSILGGLLGRGLAIGGRRRQAPVNPPPNEERRHVGRRQHPRVILNADDTMCVLVSQERLRVRDMSARGLGLEVPQRCELPASPWPAIFVAGDEQVPLTLRKVFRMSGRVGCAIEGAGPRWHETVRGVLDPLVLGSRLREIDPRFVEPDRLGNAVRWFQGGPTCDLFVWHTPAGDFVAAQLFFMGQVVEWSPDHGVRTGAVNAAARDVRGYAAAELFDLQSPPDGETLLVAWRILGAATLPDEVKALLHES
jgi:hypothetical protein